MGGETAEGTEAAGCCGAACCSGPIRDIRAGSSKARPSRVQRKPRPIAVVKGRTGRCDAAFPNRPFVTSCSDFGWVKVGGLVPDGLMLPVLREPGGLGADLVTEILGQDHVAQTDVPLRARIKLSQHEDHDDDRAVDLFRGRIVSHPGLAEVVELSKCRFWWDTRAVNQGLVPRPGVMCAAVADVVERCDP